MTLASATEATELRARGKVARRQLISRLSRWVLFAATAIGIGMLVILGWVTWVKGGSALSIDFLTSYPSRIPANAGIRPGILGSLWVVGMTIVIALPLAIGTAVFIEEFAPANRFTRYVRLNIANLAGVPSIIYGILGLAVFVRLMSLGPSILAGALTLALMIVPMTVIASSEAIRQVPPSIREGSLALGATRWQTVWHHTLPNALPGIMTGTILSVARAAGETAALIMIGAAASINFDNRGPGVLLQDFTTVPILIYSWTIRPSEDFHEIAAAAIIVLMVGVLGLNLVAVFIRERYRRSW
jgi:phosphate transport system permease protein